MADLGQDASYGDLLEIARQMNEGVKKDYNTDFQNEATQGAERNYGASLTDPSLLALFGGSQVPQAPMPGQSSQPMAQPSQLGGGVPSPPTPGPGAAPQRASPPGAAPVSSMAQPGMGAPQGPGSALSLPAIANALKARQGQMTPEAFSKLLGMYLPILTEQNQAKTAQSTADLRSAQLGQLTGVGQMTDQEKDFWAEVIRKGGALPPGLSRTAGGSNLVRELMQRVPQGSTPGGMIANKAELAGTTAGERTLGTRTANLGIGLQELKQFTPLALAASEKVNRTQFPTINAMQQAVLKGTGGEDIIRFVNANNAMINAYAQVISRGNAALTDSARHMAQEVLSTAFSKGQYRAGADQLMKEAEAALKAPAAVKSEMRAGMTGQPAAQAPQVGQYKAGDIIDHGGKKYRVVGGDPADPDIEPIQ